MRFGSTALVLLLAFSGCAGSTNQPKAATTSLVPAGPATATDDTGGIEGRIIDDERLPVAGADVALTKTAFVTKSDASGHFSFSNVPPGTYGLIAQKVGFNPFGRSFALKAGEITRANITMVAIAIPVAFNQTTIFDGYIHAGNALLDIFTSETGLPGCEKCIWKFNVSRDVTNLTFEVLFKANLPGPQPSTLYTQTYGGGGVGDTIYLNDDWPNRHKEVLEKRWKDTEKFYQLLYCGRESVCYDQKYSEYVTFFHLSGPSDDFSALPPAA